VSALATANPMVFAKPFLKWAGGKAQLLPVLRPLIHGELEKTKSAAYHEPFLGGGAVFFALRAAGFTGRACLSDVNTNLICAYQHVADYPELLIHDLLVHKARNSEEYFYEVREQFNEYVLNPMTRAAFFIYLNKTAFNGLHRVNRAGKFNVPWGKYANPAICDADNLRACSAALEKATIGSHDFRFVIEQVKKGDIAYLDPPYVPVSKTSNFVDYGKGGFTGADQAALEHVCKKLDERGCKFVLSNSDCDETRTLYRKWNVRTVLARRNVNSKGGKRGPVGELIVTNF
jgi:DNA adenine methylase